MDVYQSQFETFVIYLKESSLTNLWYLLVLIEVEFWFILWDYVQLKYQGRSIWGGWWADLGYERDQTERKRSEDNSGRMVCSMDAESS